MVRLAIIQCASRPGDMAYNREHTSYWIHVAAERGAEMVVLPELCSSGYDLSPAMAAQVAEPLDGPTVAVWHAAAKKHGLTIVAGLCESDRDTIFNTAVMIGPDGVEGRYRKSHLYYHEREIFTPGDLGLPVFDTRHGQMGMLICYDLRFPEAVRTLTLRGAQAILVPTAWVTMSGRRWDDRGYCMQAYCTMAQASMNHVFIACADTFGTCGDLMFLGASLIAGPDGWPLAGPAPADSSSCLLAELDLSLALNKAITPVNDLLHDRRTELYAG